MKTILSILYNLTGLFGDVVSEILSPPKRNTGEGSNFSHPSAILSRFNRGQSIGAKKLSARVSQMHTYVQGSTGCGKSSGIIIPELLSADGSRSYLVNDASGELEDICQAYMESKGYRTVIVNPSNPEKSDHFNPLALATSKSEIQSMTGLIINSSLGDGSSDPFWNLSSKMILSVLVEIALAEGKPTFQRVKSLVNKFISGEDEVDVLAAQYLDDESFEEYKTFHKIGSEKMKSSILFTCKAALAPLSTENMEEITRSNDIGFTELREKPVVVFLQSNSTEIRENSVLLSIFFDMAFGNLMKRIPENGEKDVYFLLDELPVLQQIPSLVSSIGVARKYRLSLLLLCQNEAQLRKRYGLESETLLSNCLTKIFYPAQQLSTSQELSKLSGFHRVQVDEKFSQVMPVLTPSQVRELPAGRVLIVHGSLPLINYKIKPYFKQFKLRRRARMNVKSFVEAPTEIRND